MCVGRDGRIIGSVTIGGCVDGRAVEVAEEVLRTGMPQRVSLPLGEEDAWAFGMTCAGAVELLVEPANFERADDAIARAHATLADLRASGTPAVEVFSLDGAPARLVVTADGAVHGAIGDEALDRAVAARALQALDSGDSVVAHVAGVGEERALFFRLHAPGVSLVIVGATEVAVALVPMARSLGFGTVVVDGRDRFATHDRFPDADEIRTGIPSEIIDSLRLGASTALVLLSHHYKYDLPVLESALRTAVGYIGVLGSRRRARAIEEHLAAAGFDAAQRRRVRVPIGLDIGARTPAEIALSVLAQVVAVRAGREGGALREAATLPAEPGARAATVSAAQASPATVPPNRGEVECAP
jgi:xanthine dehydrogenase accessory factor